MPLAKLLAGAGTLLGALLCGLLTATPADACTISATGVDFGAYEPTVSTPDDSTGSVSLNCPKAVKVATVAISAGGSGSTAQRRMTSGSSILNYNLFIDAARTLVWGNGASGTSNVSIGTGSTVLPVYGRAPARQNVRAGSYSDTTVVTVTF